jgi:hypothetical protein
MKQSVQTLQDANASLQAAKKTQADAQAGTDAQAQTDADTAVTAAQTVFEDSLNAVLTLDLSAAE